MKPRRSKAIVVDASIARSAGLTENPVSMQCRQVLQTMLDYCHRVVLSDDVSQEWRTHASRFTRVWLSSMKAKKKLVLVSQSDAYVELCARIEACFDRAKQQENIFKDFHLVVAALESDKIVITEDEQLRKLLHAAAAQVEELRSLTFANPTVSEEGIVAWLNRGAPAEKKRCLGYKPRRRD